jgi:hypothetical protein
VRASAIASTQARAGYNYAAMVNYAATWHNRYNPAWPRFDNDCTNFVSQCLRAGGWRATAFTANFNDDRYWFLANSSYHSNSWTVSQNLRNFAYLSGRAYDLSSVRNCSAGDILGYDFDRRGTLDHMQLVCANNGGNPLMTQHTPGYYGKPLSEITRGANWRLWPQRT